MIDEAKAKELLRLLRLIDAEQKAAKADAKKHKEIIDDLLDQVLEVRSELEGEAGPTLFDEPAPPTMEALAADPPADERPTEDAEEVDAYEMGVEAKLAGSGEESCPFEAGTYEHNSWINGYRETEGPTA